MKKAFKLLKAYRLECIAVGSGAIVMVLELVGARMVAPYFGTSLYVWTALIGVILGALSAGYWYGGRLADRGATNQGLMKIIVMAAAMIVVTVFIQEWILGMVASFSSDVRLSALLAALVLFAPASLLLGIVSPYVVRLKLASIKTAGAAVGRLYAAGTFGSIAGTFLAGFWLIAWFGNRNLGLLLVLALVTLSLLAAPRGWWPQRVVVALVALVGLLIAPTLPGINTVADIDSGYSRYQVAESSDGMQVVRSLVMDPYSTQSAQYVGEPDVLFFDYTRRFKEVVDSQKPNDVLVVGGGTFTFPLAIARAYPASSVTAVEIDPALTPLAKRYFSLEDRQNLAIINEDGRVFLNRQHSAGQYELAFMDAFSSLTPPYQLATTEAVSHLKTSLSNDGVAVVNLIAKPASGEYLAAVMTTYRSHFASVQAYQLMPGLDRAANQNLLIVATNDIQAAARIAALWALPRLSVSSGRVLTDDHAPVEQLINQQ